MQREIYIYLGKKVSVEDLTDALKDETDSEAEAGRQPFLEGPWGEIARVLFIIFSGMNAHNQTLRELRPWYAIIFNYFLNREGTS